MISPPAANGAWLAPGCRLDRYDLLLQVAEGGMGLLWLARQRGKHGFDKLVAIKTILPKFASDGAFQRMFLDEARVVSRIEHPNVAQVLDLGEERGVLFLVMEWIDGESLGRLGRAVAGETEARIPVGILARIMVDVCAGLHAAHELTDDEGVSLGVVHRDVSPHNLLVGFRGTTKVIDFGIAKARNRAAQDTSVGFLKGKIAYMAPEQAMGTAIDRRTDVWSAGASMYRFLAGSVPYSAPEPVAVLHRIVEGLPPAALPTTIPEAIRVVVERALDPDPNKRFATARDLGAALESAMQSADILATRDDVAAFMVEHLGEVRAARTREIELAVRESRARMRVELAHPESVSGLALPIGPTNPAGESSVVSADSWNVPIDVESVPKEPRRRPSAFPTVVIEASQPPIAAPIPMPVRMFPWASLPSVRWIAGAGVLGISLAGGLAWRAMRRSPPMGAADVAALPAHSQGPGETPILPAPGASAVKATVPALDPAPEPAPAHPQEQRESAPTPAEPSVADRGSADDLLERARHARRAGRIGEAATLFAAAVEKAPRSSEALTGLAEVDEAQGATARAIVDYGRAVAVNSRYLPARLGLADSLWTSGQRDEARAAYRAIVDQFPPSMLPNIARERAAAVAGGKKTP
jgi:serine/threonine protein kinase